MRCIVAITDIERERGLVDVAVALSAGDEVTLASVIEVPEGETLASAQTEARRQRRAMRALERPAVRVHVTVARRGWAAIAELVAKERPDLLLVAWRRPGWDFLGTTIEDVLRDPPCDVAVVKGSFSRVKRLLVPVRGGRYARLATSLATAFAHARDGSVTLLHVEPRRDQPRPSLYQLVGDLASDGRVEQLLTRVGDAAAVIAGESAAHDALVIGATGREGSDPLGPIGHLAVRGTKPVLLVRTRVSVASSVFSTRAPLPADRAQRSAAVGELVDTWFVENTFSSSEFADLGKLVREKERQGLRVSVVLPTLNEAATIQKVIRAIRTRLVERFPLVDELIVMDSDSVDHTREIAAAEGVPVHIHQRTLTEYGIPLPEVPLSITETIEG